MEGPIPLYMRQTDRQTDRQRGGETGTVRSRVCTNAQPCHAVSLSHRLLCVGNESTSDDAWRAPRCSWAISSHW